MCSSTQKKVKGVFVEQPNFCLKFWHFGKLKEASTDDVSTFVYVVQLHVCTRVSNKGCPWKKCSLLSGELPNLHQIENLVKSQKRQF